MKIQPIRTNILALAAVLATLSVRAQEPGARLPLHSYPTAARVEYVLDCMAKGGDKLAALYQCSCTVDRLADALDYDAYVEASTYAKYAALPGEGGAIFRDAPDAKRLAKMFRDLETDSLRSCGKTR